MILERHTGASVGIVGCGNILSAYMRGLRKLPSVSVVGCADVDQLRAARAADAYGIREFESVDALLADDSVDVVVNITPPVAHATVSQAAMVRGKHVFSEKPFSASLEEADALLQVIPSAAGRMGCAPDTFLAPPSQTARAAIDAGLIGVPIGASATVPHSRAEEWHPDPSFLFGPGGGPLLDLGPYYVAWLVNCLGPVVSVSGVTRIGATPRRVTAEDRMVETVVVTVPTHAVSILRFASGAVGSLTASFDLWSDHLPHLEIYGTEGILRLPDPNWFEGDVRFKANASSEWELVRPVIALREWSSDEGMLRGLGVADLVESLEGSPQRTTAELGYHVLEVLASIEESSRTDTVQHLKSSPPQPQALAAGDLLGRVIAISAAPATI